MAAELNTDRDRRATDSGFHFSDFLSHSEEPGLQVELRHLPPLGETRCLLFGPRGSGKTVLLFHLAVTIARKGGTVYLVRPSKEWEETPPCLPLGVTTSDPALANIKLKCVLSSVLNKKPAPQYRFAENDPTEARYIGTRAELCKLAACLHLLPFAPDAVIVDGMSVFPGVTDERGRDVELMRVLALLYEASSHFRRQGKPCRLIISETGSDAPPAQYVYEHWLPLFLRLTARDAGMQLDAVLPKQPRQLSHQLLFSFAAASGTVLHQMLAPPED